MTYKIWHSGFLGRFAGRSAKWRGLSNLFFRSQLAKRALVLKRTVRAALHAITGVAGVSIHDIINDPEVKHFVYQEYKFVRRIQREHAAKLEAQEETAKEKLELAKPYWKEGVLPPWDGGPKSWSAWWNE